MFVILGDPWKEYQEPAYSTDPRPYGLPLFNRAIPDDEFEREYRKKVRAFTNRDDAITFAYHCNLVSVMCPVYVKTPNGWEYSSEDTGSVADDIN